MRVKKPDWVNTRSIASAFVLSFILGGTSFALGVVTANDENNTDAKREPARDNPAPVTVEDLPTGEHFPDGLLTARLHGNLLIVPMGQAPNARMMPDLPRPERFDQRTLTLEQQADWPFVVVPAAIPAGYVLSAAGSLEGVWADGTRFYSQFGFSLEGAGYPILLTWFRTPYSDAGDPWPVPAWDRSSRDMTTIGSVAGHAAAFVHRRPGEQEISLQTVFVDDGLYVLAVEGYVDEFKKLIRVAESAITTLDERRGDQ